MKEDRFNTETQGGCTEIHRDALRHSVASLLRRVQQIVCLVTVLVVRVIYFYNMQNVDVKEWQEQKETLRIETFSDGVFCIAVTLLSIEIGVEVKEGMTNKDLFHALWEKWPICLAYVISFVNVLLAWIGHHGLFKYLHKTNNAVMIANGLLLMLVALVPFPTKTLGLFLQSGALKTAVIFYTGYFVLISLAFRLLWRAASKNRELLVRRMSDVQIKQVTRMENTGLICNAVIMAVAFLNPWAALALSFAMWVYWIVSG